jgi:hypothetical protein
MSKEPEEDLGFRVTDKRLFREAGEPGAELPPREPPKPPAEPERPATGPPESAPGTPSLEEPAPGTAAKIDFPSYILGYYTQGLMFLGEVPNPMTNRVEQDLEGAQHMIEILEMLQHKTKGNLSREEDQLVDGVLYELRMKFMNKTKRIKL